MKELDKFLKLYEYTFDDSFPMFAMQCTPQDKVIDIINECVKNDKDVYDMGYLDINDTY